MLKNSLIMYNGAGREAAESLCDIDQTKGLHELAGRICPDAVLDSQESVRLARDVGLRLGT